MLRNNPYAEWYRNTMQIHGSPTQRRHAETYGADFPYEGFPLWPSVVPHPTKAGYQAKRDIVGDLTDAV